MPKADQKKANIVPLPRQGEDDKPTEAVVKYYTDRDRMTSEMVRDFAEAKEFTLINHALYSYGMWLEHHEDAWDVLGVPGPTNRTFARTA